VFLLLWFPEPLNIVCDPVVRVVLFFVIEGRFQLRHKSPQVVEVGCSAYCPPRRFLDCDSLLVHPRLPPGTTAVFADHFGGQFLRDPDSLEPSGDQVSDQHRLWLLWRPTAAERVALLGSVAAPRAGEGVAEIAIH
jgi:hypothetical protein